MVELIVFDLDGTLVDSSRDITEALNYSLQGSGIPPLTVEQTKDLIGEGLTRLVEKVLPSEPESERESVLKKFVGYYSGHLADNTRPYPAVEETLLALDGYHKAVVSNKREDFSRKILLELGLDRFFEFVLGSDSIGKKKPSPDALFYLMRTFSTDAPATMIIGDSNLDIETGRNAGVRTVAVTYGYRPRNLLVEADFIIDDISDLVPLLSKFKYP